MAGILGPVLLPLGYKRRGTRFILEENGIGLSVYIDRSKWNSLSDRPKTFSVIIEVSINSKLYSSVSLFRLTKLKFPSFYEAFFLDKLDWSEKSRLMESFSQKQLEEIDKYLESIHWHYDSEESLVNMLNEVKTQLINVGLPTLNFAKENAFKDLESYSLSLEMKRKSNELYLIQLNPTSRFQID